MVSPQKHPSNTHDQGDSQRPLKKQRVFISTCYNPKMRTPAGRECKYFYGDYYRGRSREECRLLIDTSPRDEWTRDLCNTCLVPDILIANACEHMELRAKIQRPFPFIKRQMNIEAFCRKTQKVVAEPKIGCGECHSLPPIFTGAIDDIDPAG